MNNYKNSHAGFVFVYLENIDAHAFFRKKVVLMIRKIPSLMIIFSFYIAICSQALRIILYQREKIYLLKEKHLKTHQTDNTLKLVTYTLTTPASKTRAYFKIGIIAANKGGRNC